LDGAGFDLASLDVAGLDLVPGPLRTRSCRRPQPRQARGSQARAAG